jgi:hypothetical protein
VPDKGWGSDTNSILGVSHFVDSENMDESINGGPFVRGELMDTSKVWGSAIQTRHSLSLSHYLQIVRHRYLFVGKGEG